LKDQTPVRDIRGTFRKGGIINRRKAYRDEKGRIVNESAPEAYAVHNARDWKRNPATDKELECQNRFKAASAETKRILLAAKPEAYAAAYAAAHPDVAPDAVPATPSEEDLATLRYWQTRFRKQLRRAEPDAPIDPNTGKRKRYSRLDAFIRTCLLREMEAK
jgi:hypothetical protein